MVRVIVEGKVSRAPTLCADIGELWWAVVSLDTRPDYWGRPLAPERVVYRVRSHGHHLGVPVVIGDIVRVAGVLYLWTWYDRAGSCRFVAEVVSDAVEIVEPSSEGDEPSHQTAESGSPSNGRFW